MSTKTFDPRAEAEKLTEQFVRLMELISELRWDEHRDMVGSFVEGTERLSSITTMLRIAGTSPGLTERMSADEDTVDSVRGVVSMTTDLTSRLEGLIAAERKLRGDV